MWPTKKSPLGNVWKKSKRTSLGPTAAAWLRVLFSHTLKSPSQRAFAADGCVFGVAVPVDPVAPSG